MQEPSDLRGSYLLEVLVTVDILLVMGVLQLVGLDVLPEGLDDAGAGLRVNAEEAGQARVQLKLGRLRRRHHRITTLLFFTSRPPQSLHISFITSDTLIVSRLRNPMAGSVNGSAKWTLMFSQTAGYQRREACRLSLQQLVSWQALVTLVTEEALFLGRRCETENTTPPPSPGSPASAAGCSARSRLPAASPGSRLSPGWWACGATERAKKRHTLTARPSSRLRHHCVRFHTPSSVCFTLY